MQDVADHGTGRRRHHPDDLREVGQQLFARLVEQALGGELLLALLQQRHQGAEAGGGERLDHDLVSRAAREGGQPPGGDDFQPLLWLDAHARKGAAPDHGLDARALVLEGEIGMSGGMRPLISGNLATDPHVAVGVLDGALERRREFRDRPFRDVDAWFVHGGLVARYTPDAAVAAVAPSIGRRPGRVVPGGRNLQRFPELGAATVSASRRRATAIA